MVGGLGAWLVPRVVLRCDLQFAPSDFLRCMGGGQDIIKQRV